MAPPRTRRLRFLVLAVVLPFTGCASASLSEELWRQLDHVAVDMRDLESGSDEWLALRLEKCRVLIDLGNQDPKRRKSLLGAAEQEFEELVMSRVVPYHAVFRSNAVLEIGRRLHMARGEFAEAAAAYADSVEEQTETLRESQATSRKALGHLGAIIDRSYQGWIDALDAAKDEPGRVGAERKRRGFRRWLDQEAGRLTAR